MKKQLILVFLVFLGIQVNAQSFISALDADDYSGFSEHATRRDSHPVCNGDDAPGCTAGSHHADRYRDRRRRRRRR